MILLYIRIYIHTYIRMYDIIIHVVYSAYICMILIYMSIYIRTYDNITIHVLYSG